MQWVTDTTGRRHTCRAGDYQAMIWRASTGEWIATIGQEHAAVAHTRCLLLNAAKAWCEAQLSALTKQQNT
jgi:hypothetical protein